jgi:hypothetical protein
MLSTGTPALAFYDPFDHAAVAEFRNPKHKRVVEKAARFAVREAAGRGERQRYE